MKNVLFAVALLLTTSTVVHGDETAGENPRELLAKADEAASKLSAISYDGSFHGEGAAADRVPKVIGRVIAQRGPTSDRPRVRIEGEFAENASAQSEAVKFASNGIMAYRIDQQEKTFATGPAGDAVSPELTALLPPKYLTMTPYRQEMTVPNITYVGAEKFDGVDCHVINVSYNPAAGMGMTYWFGKNDMLLRKLENAISLRQPGDKEAQKGKIIFIANKLSAEPKIDNGTFELAAPAGFTQSTFAVKPKVGAAGLLAAGAPAPDWELDTIDGTKKVSLKGQRGKVVVMDFWASWCGPCKMAMPGLEKLHQRFKNSPVSIIGVNCRQKQQPIADAQKVIKDLGLNYTQVAGGDEVAQAYLVKGIPCFYIIDTEGKIVYATSGWQPGHEEMIGKMIEEILKTAGKQAAAGKK